MDFGYLTSFFDLINIFKLFKRNILMSVFKKEINIKKIINIILICIVLFIIINKIFIQKIKKLKSSFENKKKHNNVKNSYSEHKSTNKEHTLISNNMLNKTKNKSSKSSNLSTDTTISSISFHKKKKNNNNTKLNKNKNNNSNTKLSKKNIKKILRKYNLF